MDDQGSEAAGSERVDTSVPHPARRYDYLLGGKDNFEADRRAADEIVARHPTARLSVWENRWFLHRAVRFMAAHGVRQFLDIGTGIPTSPNTHEIAQQIDPAARVVYVDNDPLVLTHARALLTSDPRGRTAYLEADLREPRKILEDRQLLDTIDLSQPVGLLLIAVLHFIRDDDDPRAILGTLVDSLAPGSFVVASNATPEYMPEEQLVALRAVMESQWADRRGTEFAALFDRPDLEPVEPGVQSVSRWWAEDAPDPRPAVEDVACNGLVLRVVKP
jgi:predicted O-methyltransferase YrrM